MAPSLFTGEGSEILVATSENSVVGVAIFRALPGICLIQSIGVRTSEWDRGVGTKLKKAVMVEVKERNPEGCMFLSFVHKMNGRMNHINQNLQAVTAKSPDNSEYILTYISVKLEDDI
jgi:hypothetical protein